MGYGDVVELLCTHGANVNETDNVTRGTTLHLAYQRYKYGYYGFGFGYCSDIYCWLRRIRRIHHEHGSNTKAVDFLGLTHSHYYCARHRYLHFTIIGVHVYNFVGGSLDRWFSMYGSRSNICNLIYSQRILTSLKFLSYNRVIFALRIKNVFSHIRYKNY